MRVEMVNGVDVSARPECREGEHEFAAHHGYCVVCGADGWTREARREQARLERQVIR